MVSITIGSLIMLAASTVLLLGLRINHKTTEAVTQQYTARTVLAVLEKMASEGSITDIKPEVDGSWKLYGESETEAVFSYSAARKQIFTGDYSKASATPMLENVVASYLVQDEETGVLTISLEDFEQTYSSSVYCRMEEISSGGEPGGSGSTEENNPGDIGTTDSNIRNFLSILQSQIGMYGGIIDHTNCSSSHVCDGYNFFSEWYIGGYSQETISRGWNSDTPWCACFVSWGLAQAGGVTIPEEKKPGTEVTEQITNWFGNVDEFMRYFKDEIPTITDESRAGAKWIEQPTDGTVPSGGPVAGNIVFFNLIDEDRYDPSHVGVVLGTDENNSVVRVIEGNSADWVVMKEYSITSVDIIGYGVLPWISYADDNQ